MSDKSKGNGKKKDLSEEQKEFLREQFEKAEKEVDKTDAKYALDKAEATIGILADSSMVWLQKLALQAKLLWMMLKDWWDDEYDVPWSTIAAVITALLYLINPFDIIPDFIPVVGYIDDGFAIALCIDMIRFDLKKYVDEKGLSAEEYGL